MSGGCEDVNQKRCITDIKIPVKRQSIPEKQITNRCQIVVVTHYNDYDLEK